MCSSDLETVTLSYSVLIDDQDGGQTPQSFDVVITGTNDAPTLAAGVAAAVEDGPAVDVDLVALGSLFASFARRRWTNGARSWPAENWTDMRFRGRPG